MTKGAISSSRGVEGTGFSSISGKVLWLDGDDPSSMSLDGSGNVSQWSDKSGYGNHVYQSDVDKRPLYVSSGINAIGSIEFDGVDEFLQHSATYSSSLNSATLDGWLVFMRLGAIDNVNRHVYESYDVTGDGNWIRQGFRLYADQYGGRMSAIFARNEVSTVSCGAGSNPDGSVLVARLILGPGKIYMDIDNTNAINNIVDNYTPLIDTGVQQPCVGAIRQGDTGSPSEFWEGQIGEIVFFNRHLNPTETSIVKSYINGKWGRALT